MANADQPTTLRIRALASDAAKVMLSKQALSDLMAWGLKKEDGAMNQTPCPLCGKNSLTEKHGEYRFEPPEAIPGGAIVVTDATWYECGACHEQVVPPALESAIERERYRRLGLLTPEEIKAVRERTGLS